jgi:SNF2 family DNA or RNA helicase
MQICGGFFPYKEDGSQKIMSIGKVNPKLERLKEDLEETNGQVIIWAQFVKELELLYNELKKDYSCRLYYGKTGKYQREQIIKEFKAGDFQIFIGNPSTAGFGLNLQNSSMQYFFSNSFRTENRLQAEDRSHRIGQKSICVYKDIIAKNTIDEKVFKVLSEGKDLNDFFKSNSLGDILADGAD